MQVRLTRINCVLDSAEMTLLDDMFNRYINHHNLYNDERYPNKLDVSELLRVQTKLKACATVRLVELPFGFGQEKSPNPAAFVPSN